LLGYLLLQGALALTIGLLTQLQGLIMGLYMAMVGEAAGIYWPNRRAVALSASFYVMLMILNILIVWDLQALLQFLPILGGLLAFVIIYVALYVRQVQAREEAQNLLGQLEVAHGQLQTYADQVEELTISQERQRMARELHDTLAQGLAGLIMQLEAADSHLDSGDPARAQAVVQQATQRAKTTLREARRAIQALRSSMLDQESLIDALGREVEGFAATTDVRAAFQVDGGIPDLAPEAAQSILRIVQAALSNVARHARAHQVRVQLAQPDGMLQVMVQDDGVGFDAAEALSRPGCYGLAGMHERAERLGGTLHVASKPGAGTTVTLEIGEERT
jgi:NarL family two-component system sensor histidine kinase YdfH